jgi:gallate dioxygenase
MARIVGGIATSHTPTIGFALDAGKQEDPAWAPIFRAFRPVQQWLAEKKPDVLLMIYNDHVTSFFFDHYSAFALGVDDSYAVADEGGNPRAMPPVAGHAALARHLGQSLMADEFDMSFFRDKPLDHGCFSPLSVLWTPEAGQWPGAIVPLQVGVLQFPVPSARRCFRLGQALRRAIESCPEDLDVAIVATGGLSHQVHGERAGFNNTAWDHEFLDLFERDPQALTELTQADYAKRGGFEAAEVIMWLVMRGAMSARIRRVHSDYTLPSMTGIAVAVYENEAAAPTPERVRELREHMQRQLAGIEELPGTYPYTLERSAKGYRLNKFLHRLIEPAFRARFLADEAACFAEAALSEEERDLVRRRDWRGLIHYGAIFFVLEKLGAVVGVSNLHIYAAMRGETLDVFRQTRNAPGALYSVAGTQGAAKSWDAPAKSTRD